MQRFYKKKVKYLNINKLCKFEKRTDNSQLSLKAQVKFQTMLKKNNKPRSLKILLSL